MELTPENVIEKIEKLLGVIHLEYIDEATDLIREYGEQQREVKQEAKDAFFDKWKNCIPSEISLDGTYDDISGDFQVVNGPEQFKKELNDL